MSAINHVHEQAGLKRPGISTEVTAALAWVRRTQGTRQRRVAALLLEDLRDILLAMDQCTWPAVIATLRDSALLLTGWVGAFRRSELVGLCVPDLTVSPGDGLLALVRRSKTDQEGEGLIKALPAGSEPLTCTPCALWRWLDVVDLADAGAGRSDVLRHLSRQGPVTHVCDRPWPADGPARRPLFRPVSRDGSIAAGALSDRSAAQIVKRRAAAAGIDPALVSGHSLRAGFVTQAFRDGADSAAIRRQTGHSSDAILEVYRRERSPMVGNAATMVGL